MVNNRIQVATIDNSDDCVRYLESDYFDVKANLRNVDPKKPVLVSIGCKRGYKEENIDRSLYFSKSSLFPYGFSKVKAFNNFTVNKIVTLDMINKLNLSTYVNPILYTNFMGNMRLSSILDKLDKFPDKLVIKNSLGARQINVCFCSKKDFIRAMHNVEHYLYPDNAPDDVFNYLKPINSKNFKNFMFTTQLYVEEDLTDRLHSEYRVLLSVDGNVMVWRREGYGNSSLNMKSNYIEFITDIKDFISYIYYKGNTSNYKQRVLKFIEFMDAPIISLDVLVLDKGNSFTIIEASPEFGIRDIDPLVIKEFINKSYLEYCKKHGLIK